MTITDYKTYFNSAYKGAADFDKNILSPILGKISSGSSINYALQPGYKDAAAKANIKKITDVGEYSLGGNPIRFFDIALEDNCNLSMARVNIRKVVTRLWKEEFSGFIIVFHYDNPLKETWRFSWVERRTSERNSTPGKRYTYLCGPSYSCRTIAERFDVLQKTSNKTLDSITKAFDVEALSDEFFKEYKVMYDDIVQWITGQRIVKKGDKWKLDGTFGTGLGNSVLNMFIPKFGPDEGAVTKAVRDYVKKLMGRLVFIQFLQKKDGWLTINGKATSNFLLDLFNGVGDRSKDNFIEKPLEQVVYLLLNNENRKSGDEKIDGLTLGVPFLNGGLFEPDAYDKLKIQLPKEFFHNPYCQDVKRELKKQTALRPDDQMLKQCGILDLFNHYNFTIDENDSNNAEVGVDPEMLGKIFENLLEDNKEKGAFYTPKEIVQYMCKESLIAYLCTKVPGYDVDIRTFVEDEDKTEVLETEKEKVLDALRNVKICDPAIGSGAFPMGLLNLLVALREKLAPNTQRAELKKEIIQNNIYGVDIEKGAIDIARLRFWLSIMVDEASPTPLPNFDYKFMQGNSLLECYNGVELNLMKSSDGSLDFAAAARNDLQVLLQKYFDCTDHLDKTNLQKDIEDKIKEILKLQSYTIDLSSINLSGNDKFFLWHTWFAEVFAKGGFDIVIGNPPYVSVKAIPSEYKAIYSQRFVTGKGRFNLFTLFIELFSELSRENGTFCLIIPEGIYSNIEYRFSRELLIQQCKINRLCTFTKRVFDASVDTTILLISKKEEKNKRIPIDTDIQQTSKVLNQIDLTKIPYFLIPVKLEGKSKKIVEDLLLSTKYDRLGKTLEIQQGIIYTGQAKKDVFADYVKNKTYKPILDGRDIVKWRINWDIKEYDKYLSYTNKLHRPREERLFLADKKLLLPRRATQIVATIDYQKYYALNTAYICLKEENKYEMEFLLGIMNSRLVDYFYTMLFMGWQITIPALEVIPVPNCKKDKQNPIISLVNQILSDKKNDPQADSSVLERKIDILVYLLYDLTFDEMQIVESTSDNPIYIDGSTYERWRKTYDNGKGKLPSEKDLGSAIRASFAYTNCTSSPRLDLTTEEIMTLAQIDHFTDYGFQGINYIDDKHKQIEVILKNKKNKKVEFKITIGEARERIKKIEGQLKALDKAEKQRKKELEKAIEKARKDFAKKQEALKNKKHSLEDDSEGENNEETTDNNALQEKIWQLNREYERDLARIKAKRTALEKEKEELEDEIAKHEGAPENTEITIIRHVSILGEYYRAERQIILYLETIRNSTSPSYTLFQTYIHEMFHAYYDANPAAPDYYIEKIEEPITELGALTFIEKFTGKNKDKEFMDFAVEDVEKKQFNPAICHYGFGTYLFRNYKGLVQQYYDNRSKIVNPSSDLTVYEDMFRIAYPANESDCYENLKKVLGI